MNGITMWRLGPGKYGRIRPKCTPRMPVSDICLLAPIVPNQASVQAFQYFVFKLTANHGEARAGTGSKPRGPHSRGEKRCEYQRARKRLASGASVESALLRRSRYANRSRRYLVLYGHADRPTSFGPAVFHDPQARGRQALFGDAG